MMNTKAIPVPPPPGYLEEWRTTNHTCLVTGATDGIGRALAIRLADAGQTLAIVGRSEEKVQAVLSDINDAGPRYPHCGFVADLSCIAEVDRLAKELSQKLPDLNRVALCASAMPGFRGMTADGVEAGFSVNCLSRVLLLDKLTPLLKKQEEPRVVSFASPATRFEPPDLKVLNDPDGNLNNWDRNAAHTNYNLLFVAQLAKRLKDTQVCVNAFGPGLVPTRQVNGYSAMRRLWFSLQNTLIGRTPAYAALPAMHMLLSQDFAEKTGGFYECSKKIPLDESFLNEEIQTRLWDETAQLVQLAQANQREKIS
ncbi:hypothetical protein GCM10007094_09760 [Pseudovibrio japonicus]|uniref:Uncharacterized protein n=1 Tax=Pseudovibrio japonicus TaxID=366534 RepID=A0ABQ3E2M9_9HYPH|nr:SDR family NAD(P)-dependent oxidoreductase [Pseudovibrio japonicus]GHB23859.1 hypothetical protein GCM10007094_09760 [Pseudovibrio japonicus]